MLHNMDVHFETEDYLVQGKMVVAQASMSEFLLQNGIHNLPEQDRKHIRHQLCMQIAEFMLDNNLMEFTSMQDPMTMNTIIRGRIFVTPDNQTKIIRTLKR